MSAVAVKHTLFRIPRESKIACQCERGDCGWTFSTKSRGSATRAAAAHVKRNAGHRVVTSRLQIKLTYAQPGNAS
jgi:hypothetical protein